jgi:hypothetical protein
MMTQHARQPISFRYQDAQRELTVGQIDSMETYVDHGEHLEGQLGQAPRYVEIGQQAVDVAGFDQNEIAAIAGKAEPTIYPLISTCHAICILLLVSLPQIPDVYGHVYLGLIKKK